MRERAQLPIGVRCMGTDHCIISLLSIEKSIASDVVGSFPKVACRNDGKCFLATILVLGVHRGMPLSPLRGG